MDQTFILNMVLLIAVPVSFILGLGIQKLMAHRNFLSAQSKAQKIIDDAVMDAESRKKEMNLDARSDLMERQSVFEEEMKKRREDHEQKEKRVVAREESVEDKIATTQRLEEGFCQREKDISFQEESVKDKEEAVVAVLNKQKEFLEKISGLSVEEAKKIILAKTQQELRKESAALIKKLGKEAVETADRQAKDLIALAIKKYASSHVAETSVSVIQLPNDEIKGRIIGREGRNIRALEAVTGVSVIVDDTPEVIVLSSFDPVRREIAKLSLERLIKDGRIHPTRIDEMVEKVSEEMDETINILGENLVLEVGVHGIHPEMVKLLGRLNYRTSYGQNIWHHSKEVAFIMASLASEMNLNVDIAKRVGLLHDVGKAMTHEVQGGHALIGADLAKKYNEDDLVVNAIASHHEDEEAKSIYAVLLCAADAISASRPAARRSSVDDYINRLEGLETIANGFKGVEKTFALQAGRELRVIVEASQVTDDESIILAREIAQKIENEMTYPGQIKVTLLRETKAVEYAR